MQTYCTFEGGRESYPNTQGMFSSISQHGFRVVPLILFTPLPAETTPRDAAAGTTL